MTIFHCDFTNENDKKGYISLLTHYMNDPMGNTIPHTQERFEELVGILESMPHAFVILGKIGEDYCAMATCFVTLSTFSISPVVNIHDFVVKSSHRGKGAGKEMLEFITQLAHSLGCGKITLEVRDDNHAAQHLYTSQGFAPTTPVMLFWEKSLLP